jgi:2-polyprenyl-3-methyl-5-hydroxy-6-metoxy-1,4-benzoquinol methylase
MKTLFKEAARKFGYEIQKIERPSLRDKLLPPWVYRDGPAPTDELEEGPWFYHVLQMANRHYRPSRLAYHRTSYGEDHRVKYIVYFLDLRDVRILELGPLEGHHSVLFEKLGVRENIAIEARADNLRKCSRIKEKYGLTKTRFIQNDLEKLYSGSEQPKFSGQFDLVMCLGLLYHMPDPGKALEWCRSQSKSLFLGTHYVEVTDPWRSSHFPDIKYIFSGRSYQAKLYKEGGLADPISGMSPASIWLNEKDLIEILRSAGYSRLSILGKDLQNNAPHITILAED